MSSWLCSCGAHNAKAHRFCEGCGAEAPTLRLAPVSSTTPAPQPPPRRRCPHVEDPDALCQRCAREIASAQAQFRQHLAVIAERNARARHDVEVTTRHRLAASLPQTFAPTCAGCATVIEKPAHRVYEDARLWHRVCWERERARVKRQRKVKRADAR